MTLGACVDEGPVAAPPPPISEAVLAISSSGQDLGALPTNNDASAAYGINNSGVVVGWAANGSGFRAAPGSTMDSLPVKWAWAINDVGTITGFYYVGPVGHAFRLSPGAEPEDLGTLQPQGEGWSEGRAINAAGTVTGFSHLVLTPEHTVTRAFRAPVGGPMQDLGTLRNDPAEMNTGNGINDAGVVVGVSSLYEEPTNLRAFIATPGQPMQDILGHPGRAEDINNAGVVVGTRDDWGVYTVDRAFRRAPGDTVEYLPGLAPDKDTQAHSINEFGDIAGLAQNSNMEARAVVWPASGGIVDLGHINGGYVRINDRRQVSGTAYVAYPLNHAYRWTVSAAPAAPGEVRANGSSAGRVMVRWSDRSGDEVNFRIRRSLRRADGTFAPYLTLGSRGANNQSFLDSTVAVGSTYRYLVQACNAAGCSRGAASTAVTVVLPPVAPSEVDGRVSGIQMVDLTWRDNSDSEIYFRLRRSDRGPDGSFGAYVNLFNVGPDATGSTDREVVAGGVYRYQVQACNGGGCSTSGTEVVSVPSVPLAPGGLVARVAGPTRVALSWTDGSSNETSFRVRRALRNPDGSFAPWELPQTVGANTTSFADEAAAPGTTYRYQVQSCNGGGCSGYVASPTVTTPAT